MKNLFLIVTAIAAIGGLATNRADACALRLPTFELAGFPISQARPKCRRARLGRR
jgi:hypothetical protein